MCIYYGNDDATLTYNSQEHIFPSTIGGSEMLPKGYVSDKANQYFSKLESELVTDSLFGLCKMFHGPGGRGKGTPGRMPITMMKMEDRDELGFVLEGKPITIPQIILSANMKESHIIRDNVFQTDKDWNNLFNKIKDFTNETRYVLLNIKPEKSLFYVAYYNATLYIATNEKENIIEHIKHIQEKVLPQINLSTSALQDINQPKTTLQMTVNIDNNSRVFAKIALNVLAKIKGKEYLKNKKFNNIKDCILGNIENIHKQIPQQYNCFSFKAFEHFCVFMNVDSRFIARVVVYNQWCMDFILSDSFDSFFNNPYVYVCDWKNKKEYEMAGGML